MSALRPAVIVDMDGTLVDVSGVRHYVMDPRKKDFNHFHAGAALCPPIPSTVALLACFVDRSLDVLVVTARKQRWEYVTRVWLRKWGINHDALLMRADDDDRKDHAVKADILDRIERTHRVILAIDDNPSIIALWESRGIPTVRVPGWIE